MEKPIADHFKDSTATIRDVARLARVSPATVSRVMSGVLTVSDENRRRVEAAVLQTNYRPNRLARSMRRQRADMIGVVVSDIENPHFSEAVRVIEDVAFRDGYRVLLCNSDETVEKQRQYLELLADERVLAVIFSPADSLGTGVGALMAAGIPIVALDRSLDDPRIDVVVAANHEGVKLATEHLLWLGHTRIGFVGGHRDVVTSSERLDGYASTMRAAGNLPVAVNGGFRVDIAELAVARLLAAPKRPTALLVANNLMTLGALRAARKAGLSLPDDLAIVAVDDPPWAELIAPPLTTLRQPVREMATAAMQLAFERIGGRTAARRLVLPLELQIRESCGMPAVRTSQGT